MPIDPATVGILQKVTLGTVKAAVGQIVKMRRKTQMPKLAAATSLNERQSDLVLTESARHLSKLINWAGPGSAERVAYFLLAPETASIVRQLVSIRFDGARSSIKDIQTEFALSLAKFLNVDVEALNFHADSLFQQLVDVFEGALSSAMGSGSIEALDAKNELRMHIVRDELAAIKKNIDLLTSRVVSVAAILAFERTYRGQVSDRYRNIVPPNFDSARKIPIDDIYVAPDFHVFPAPKSGTPQPISLEELTGQMQRTVLLGNPGAGKSTLSAKICHELGSDDCKLSLAGRYPTPILVVLRDYGTVKRQSQQSIVDFIYAETNARYQIKPPDGAIEYLLLNGRAAVIFDGLDELVNTSDRASVSADVESFCSLFPNAPVMVTSREVGYEQAPLDGKRFDVFRLCDFNETQVGEYVRRFFKADADLGLNAAESTADSFLEESGSVTDLRSNPLMLGLMCNIYRGEKYIPRNRPDVYEKCATMLFDRWDRHRGIRVDLPFEAHVQPAMKHLAHWIYSDEALQAGVSEGRLVEEATNYLLARRFEDRDEAQAAAKAFVEFCHGRAWVFTDTGTLKSGEHLYQFTHRTFLEYFAAGHLVRSCPTPASLIKVLLPRIEVREWDVVAQLAFQMQNKAIEGASDKLLSALLRRRAKRNAKKDPQSPSVSWALVLFAARCLEFMIPSPKVVRDIVLSCLEMAMALNTAAKPFKTRTQNEWISLIAAVLSVTSENRHVAASVFNEWLRTKIRGDDPQVALVALEIALKPSWAIRQRRVDFAAYDFWQSQTNELYASEQEVVQSLLAKSIWLCEEALRRKTIGIARFVELHGLGGIFGDVKCRFFETISPPIAIFMLEGARQHASGSDDFLKGYELAALEELGNTLLAAKVPWIKVHRPQMIGYPRFGQRTLTSEARRKLTANQTFSAVMLMAAEVELLKDQTLEGSTWAQDPELGPVLAALASINKPGSRAIVGRFLSEAGATKDHLAFFDLWANEGRGLVARSDAPEIGSE